MIEPNTNVVSDLVLALLIHYSFDLNGYTATELISHWLKHYPANSIRLAVIEALYLGRYKAISIEQILANWQRRNQVTYHFNHEFERLVCDCAPLNRLTQTTVNPNPPLQNQVVTFTNGDHHFDPATPKQKHTGNKQHLQQINSSAKDSAISTFIPDTKADDSLKFYTKLKEISQSDRSHKLNNRSI